MKKKTVTKKVASKKTVKRTVPRSSHNEPSETFILRRIVIVSACLVLAIAGVVGINRHSLEQAVAGESIMQGLFDQATIQLPVISNVSSYNIYYGQTGQPLTNAVRNIPSSVHSYTISALKKGVTYEYQVSVVNSDGREIYFSEVKPLTGLQSM